MRRASKVDGTAQMLTKIARQLGVQVLPLGGAAIDAIFLVRGRPVLVDFKTPKGKKTPTQIRLESSGWPIHFLRSADDVLNLVERTR